MFWECMEDAKNDNKKIGMDKINTFMNFKKKVKVSYIVVLLFVAKHTCNFDLF